MERGQLLQAQFMFPKNESFVPVREAMKTALERRHAEIRKLRRKILESIGIISQREGCEALTQIKGISPPPSNIRGTTWSEFHMKPVSVEEAVAMIPAGASVMVGGFMGVGTPERLLDE